MTLKLPPTIAKALEDVFWLRDGATSSGGEFVEKLHFPYRVQTSSSSPETSIDQIRCSLAAGSQIPATALTRAIEAQLRDRGHAWPNLVSGLILSWIAVLRIRASHMSAVEILELLLDTSKPSPAWHYRVMNENLTGPATFMSKYSIGAFWFGPLTEAEVVSKVSGDKAAQSQASRVVKSYSGQYVMRYEMKTSWVLVHSAWLRVFSNAETRNEGIRDEPWLNVLNAIANEYFVRLQIMIDENAHAALQRIGAICALHGGESIEAKKLWESESQTRFTIFASGIRGEPREEVHRLHISWITESSRTQAQIDGSMQKSLRDGYEAKLSSMEATYNSEIQKYKANDLHPIVSRFVDRLASAHSHVQKRNTSAAFLDYIIAIEILFGKKGEAADAVSSRTAVACGLVNPVQGEFARTLKEMKRLYDLRSLYVHRGEESSQDDLESLKRIIERITPVVLRWNERAAPEDEAAHAEWLKLVDYARATIEIGRTVASPDLFAMGVLESQPPSTTLKLSEL